MFICLCILCICVFVYLCIGYGSYSYALKANLNTMGIKPADLEGLAADRTTWRATCQQAVVNFEESRVRHLEDKRRQRKTGHVNTCASPDLQCDVCGRNCGSKIGLFSHRRTHPWSEIRSVDGSVHTYGSYWWLSAIWTVSLDDQLYSPWKVERKNNLYNT